MVDLVATGDIIALDRDLEALIIFKALDLIKMSLPSSGLPILGLKGIAPSLIVPVQLSCFFISYGVVESLGTPVL